MPNRFDESRFAGPIEERIPGALLHCYTTLPNHDCPQLRAGCLGCTFASTVSGTLSPWWSGAQGLALRVTFTADDTRVREALSHANRSA